MIQIDRRASLSLSLAALALVAAGCGTARNTPISETPECQRCHGGASGNAAPPRSVAGETVTTALGVGAHQAHLTRSAFTSPVLCGECHVVPTTLAGHVDGDARPAFTGRAVLGGALPSWTPGTATCSSVYCHGGTLQAGGSFTEPVWNAAGQGHLGCGSCHGAPPPAPHPAAADLVACHACHPTAVDVAGELVPPASGGTHLDGEVQVKPDLACDACHGAPPASGAHLAHVGFLDVGTLRYGDEWRTEELDPAGAQGRYSFGCGACHPRDDAKHRDGTVEVELSAAAGVAGGLRALNGSGAAYAAGRCSGVYCHSSGQASPAFSATPGWTSGAALGCGGCHGNPPSYANGGPDGAANSHIFLNWYGSEGGHFAGLPGPSLHRSRHGSPAAFAAGQRAAPMTCQTCHAETVDPANVAAGGLFYLDTTITTRLPGGDAARLTTPAWKDTQCGSCHDGGAGSPPQGAGKVRPVRHVNGRRDVVFDGRAAPPGYFASLGASAPTRPYFTTGALFPFATTLPAGAGWDPSAPSAGQRATLSYELSGATYQPATRTCSSVACHLGNGVRWGQQDFETPAPTCTGCHAIQ